jgi:transposase, IS605 orfB family|nr:MAG TPA: endonuclease [Caudoviricetes sp.]
MYLVERHIIKPNNSLYKELDNVCFLSKNLYNKALYLVRQHYFSTKEYLDFYKLCKLLVDSKDTDYYALNTKVSKGTLLLLDRNFKSFFSLIKKKKNKDYNKPTRIPKYLDKEGRYTAVFEKHAVSKRFLDRGLIKLANISNVIKTKVKLEDLKEVRVLHRSNHYILEVVYKKEEKPLIEDNGRYAAVDLGLNNLATVCSNVEKPFIINGRPLKSINQRWNKHKANLQSRLTNNIKSSKQLALITNKRNNRVKDYLHKSSRKIVNFLVSKNISTLVIGYNEEWKQNISIGKVNNQSFTSIPFYTFINQLEYKCKLEGINVILTEKSYTSKCSFLDNEPLEKQDSYLGKRIKRGLFRSAKNKLINADLNGALNILKKVIGEFQYPIGACCTPVRIILV